MNLSVVLMAGLCSIVLAGFAMNVFTLYRSGKACDASARGGKGREQKLEAEIARLQAGLDTLSAQVRELERQPASAAPGVPRQAMNLSRRSQAIRMHRRGEDPAQIAASLELPRQEVDLLLKVHQIVVSGL
jgi:hypothetical protein